MLEKLQHTGSSFLPLDLDWCSFSTVDQCPNASIFSFHESAAIATIGSLTALLPIHGLVPNWNAWKSSLASKLPPPLILTNSLRDHSMARKQTSLAWFLLLNWVTGIMATGYTPSCTASRAMVLVQNSVRVPNIVIWTVPHYAVDHEEALHGPSIGPWYTSKLMGWFLMDFGPVVALILSKFASSWPVDLALNIGMVLSYIIIRKGINYLRITIYLSIN